LQSQEQDAYPRMGFRFEILRAPIAPARI